MPRKKSILKEQYPGTWQVWQSMRGRCNTLGNQAYKYYGKRGIKVCERWANFDNFIADMGPRPNGLTLDRMDNDGNYEPSNCRWATRLEQIRNSRKGNRGLPKSISFNGKSLSIISWAQELGIKSNTLTRRFLAGWTVERALAFPVIDGRLGNQNARKK